MQVTKALDVKSETANGNGKTPPPPVTAVPDTPAQTPIKPTIPGRIFETLAAALIAGCFVVIGLNLEGWFYVVSFVLCLALGLGVGKLALWQAGKAAEEEEKRKKRTQYKVTWARLRILEKVGVPDDVITALQFLLPEDKMSEDTLFEKIATDPNTDLGIDRANEFRYTILKYTEVKQSSESDPPADKDTAPTNQST